MLFDKKQNNIKPLAKNYKVKFSGFLSTTEYL